MKFRAHETFFIRKGWLSKGLKHVDEIPDIFLNKDIKPAEEIGIGTNMVKALRYWLQATGLTEEVRKENKTVQERTDLGNILWKYDRYLEEETSLWLLHYKLAGNKELATAWYWFFNIFDVKQFNKEEFVVALDGFVKYNIEGAKVARSSLEADFDCLIGTYISRSKRKSEIISPENNIDSPLGVLELLEIVDLKQQLYRKKSLRYGRIPSKIILGLILDQHYGKKEIKISSLLNDEKNVGRVFNMGLNTLNIYLDDLKRKGYLEVIRTAGLDVVRMNDNREAIELIEEYYTELDQEGLLISNE